MSSRLIIGGRAVYSKGAIRPPADAKRMPLDTRFTDTRLGVIPLGVAQAKPATLDNVPTDGGENIFPPDYRRPFADGAIVYDIADNLHFHQLSAARMLPRDSWASADYWLERWKGSRYKDLLLLCEARLMVPGKLIGSGLKRFRCNHEGSILAHVAEFTRRRPGSEPSAVVRCTMAEQWKYRTKIKRDNELRDAKTLKQQAFAERVLGRKA